MVGQWHDPVQNLCILNHCASNNDRRVTHPRPSLITSTFNFLYCTFVSRKSIRFTRMPSNARTAAWRFDALWAVPVQLVGPSALIDKKCLHEELDSFLKRDLIECPTFPTYTSNVELKFKLSDLEVVLANACTKLPVTGYIQSAPHYNIDSGNLLRWFEANWSPVTGLPLTVNWFGKTIITNGPKWTLRIGIRKCMASLPSPHAVQAGNRCVFATESRIT
jgi:hypothetical protein